MVFETLVATLRGRGKRTQPRPSSMMNLRADRQATPDLSNAEMLEEIARTVQLTRDNAAKKRLPALRTFAPLTEDTINDIAGYVRDSEARNANSGFPTRSGTPDPEFTLTIRRKPLPSNNKAAVSLPVTMGQNASSTTGAGPAGDFSPNWEPSDPARDPTLHVRARSALKRKYRAKMAVSNRQRVGAGIADWVDDYTLDCKVTQDIIWVRARYFQAGKAPPSDAEIIWWYDAADYEN